MEGKILMTYVDFESDEGKKISEFIGVHGNLPQFWILDVKSEKKENRYRYKGNIESPKDIIQFYKEFRNGHIEKHVKSEPIP